MVKNYLNALKTKGNFTYADISNLSGIPEATIRKIFTGETADPRFETIVKLIISMGGSLDEAIADKKEEELETNVIISLKEVYESRIEDIKFCVSALKNEYYLLLCIMSGILIFATAKYWMRLRNIIQIGDAFGLGVFTFLGAQKAFEAGLGCTGIILSGVVTAIGGGIIRDVLAGTVPVVLKSDFYATASMLGGALFCIMVKNDLPPACLFPTVAGVVIALRLLALHYKIQLPAAGYLRHERAKFRKKTKKR